LTSDLAQYDLQDHSLSKEAILSKTGLVLSAQEALASLSAAMSSAQTLSSITAARLSSDLHGGSVREQKI